MLTENAPKSQLACGKLPTSGQIETLSLSFSPSRSSLVAQTHFKRATIQLTRDTLRGSSPATPRDGTPAVLDTKGYTMPSSDRPSCAIPARQPHPQSPKKDLLFRCHSVLATPPRPTHKAGDPGTGKPPTKFQKPSLSGVYFGSSPNSSRSSGFDKKPSRSCSMASFASGSELNF